MPRPNVRAGFVMALWILCATGAQAAPKEKNYGFWVETYRGFNYAVDTKAQLCFVYLLSTDGGGGITTVPCEKLAKRGEWKPILTWIEGAPSGSNESSSP